MSKPILLLKNVSIGYDQWPTIADLTLEARGGEVTAIVGPNAIGKTTLFRGLFSHAGAWLNGTVSWQEKTIPHLRARHVGTGNASWVRQDRQDFPGLTVIDGLQAAILTGGRRARAEKESAVIRWLPELRSLLHQRMETLSGGQRALVGLAFGLVNCPMLLCLDEPAANLDECWIVRVQDVVRNYVKDRGAACLVIEHREQFLTGLTTKRVTIGQQPPGAAHEELQPTNP